MQTRLILILFSFLVFISLFCVSASSKTIHVDAAGDGDYENIQNAIDNATDGDTIIVNYGTYYGYIEIDKSISLIGEPLSGNKPIISINQYDSNKDAIITLNSDNLIIDGFEIQCQLRKYIHETGIEGVTSHTTISNNEIYSGYYGIKISDTDYAISYENVITNNLVTKSDSIAIYLPGHDGFNNITDNIIKDNNDNGLVLYFAGNNLIKNNEITGNNGFGLGCFRSSNNEIINNIITNHRGYDFLHSYHSIHISTDSDNNLIKGNTIKNSDQGIYLWGASNSTIAGNTISNNDIGINITKYCADNKILSSNAFSNNEEDVSGSYIATIDTFQILNFISYILLILAMIEAIILNIFMKKTISRLKTNHPNEYKKLPKTNSGKIKNIKTYWYVIQNKVDPENDLELKKTIKIIKVAWMFGILAIVAIIFIIAFIIIFF